MIRSAGFRNYALCGRGSGGRAKLASEGGDFRIAAAGFAEDGTALLPRGEKESPQRRSVVEMKLFLGLSDEDAAQALNLTLHTFQREWYRVRRWLFERLNANPSERAQGESARGATPA